MAISIAEWRYQSSKILSEISEIAEIEVNAILCNVLNKDLAWCLTNSNFVLDQPKVHELNEKIISLLAGIPLPYVLGTIEFFGNQFFIDENVLIPRPETELLVETAIEWINRHNKTMKVIDVGCGSGIIIISILKRFSQIKGFGLDISRKALNISKGNKNYHNINYLEFVQMDCLSGIGSKFDVIVANLPYIPADHLSDLKVSKFEPDLALNGGEDGLLILNRLIEQIPSHLNSPGLALLEIQFDQSARVIQKAKNYLPKATVSIIKIIPPMIALSGLRCKMPEIIDLRKSFEKALEKSVSILNKGGLIVFPTDTVYGLAAKFDEPESIERIYQVKGRDQTKALAVLVANLNQIKILSPRISENTTKLIKYFWPGALTLFLEKREDLKAPLTIDNSIGIRIPDDRFVRELSERIGPLATTSANLSGFPNTTKVDEVLAQIGNLVDLILDGGECEGGIPSSVVDCRSEEVKILRDGAIPKEEIYRILTTEI
jgi:release factor-specific protein-(glutamine-N5) methyltransferase/tRNA threonylcarbamoyl adenosine modification protein (Sua5/YciO/YrdC/YwlC family)